MTKLPRNRAMLNEDWQIDQSVDQHEGLKTSIRTKVAQMFQLIKRQFGDVKVRYQRLKKNTTQVSTLTARSIYGQNTYH